MRVNLPTAAAVFLFAIAVTCLPASAQALKVDVPFAFTVAGKAAPAGAYEMDAQSPNAVRVRSVTTPGIEFFVPVITRLDASSGAGARVVFDKVGAESALSEVWIGGDDGYLVNVPKGAHTHQSVKAAKK